MAIPRDLSRGIGIASSRTGGYPMRRRGFVLTLGILLVAASISDRPLGADATRYTVTDLGTLDNLVPTVTGINRSGQISGNVNTADGSRAVRYTPGVGWEYVTGLVAGSFATGINDFGDLTGYYSTPGGTTHAFRYRDGSGIDDISGLANALDAFGLGINNAGDVVGYSDTNIDTRGWVARLGQSPVQLPDLGGAFALPCSINVTGQIVGTAATPSGASHAYRIDADGTTTDAGSFDGATGASSGCAVDEAGSMGGYAERNGRDTAFRFGTGGLVDVEGALPSTLSSVSAMANGVSVGSFMSSVDSASHAFSWTDSNGSVDLNDEISSDSGWFLFDAMAINASGQIVGDGEFQGSPRSYLLTPSAPKDTTPPVISAVTASPSLISPAQGQMVTVTLTVNATDDSHQAPACKISGIAASGAAGTEDSITAALTADVKAIGGGTYAMTVTCADAAGNSASSSVSVTVPADTTPPVISSVLASPSRIWPPNHKMVTVNLSVRASDNVDASPTCALTDVTGNHRRDRGAFITGPLSARVRALGGRVYTLTVVCADAAGNRSSRSVSVTVGHDVTPPIIRSISISPEIRRPLVRRFIDLLIHVDAIDDSGEMPSCRITSIRSNEDEHGDQVMTSVLDARILVWKARNGGDRVYTVKVTCTDRSGNSAHATTQVTVPGDRQ